MDTRGERFSNLLRKSVGLAAGLTIAVLFVATAVSAEAPASISGMVYDPSGALVVGATVIIQSSDSNRDQSCLTGQDGSYSFSGLTGGRYSIRIDVPGFAPYRRDAIAIDGNTELDARLLLKSDSTTVEVPGEAVQIDLSVSERGETIAAKTMTSVPLNGRAFTDLLAIQPGVVPVSTQQPNAVLMSGVTSTPPSGDLNAGSQSISGQRETSNGFRVNGSDVEEDVNMGTAILPNLDSIQEFRVLTGNFDAAYGNYSGGQILVLTRSGTNRVHGDVFEFLRNTELDARNYFSDQRAKYDQNQFGGTLGGPIQRDKTFFFFDYQHTGMTQGVETGRISVPSLQERSGDLSAFANSLTGTVNGQYWANLLSQKLGYAVEAGERYYLPGCVNASQCVLPNAIVPNRAWSAPAKALLQFIPQPNQAENVFSTSAYDETLRDDKSAIRIDSNTRWGTLGAYYFVDDYRLNNPYPTGQGGANVPGFNAMTLGRAQLLSLSLTKPLGANTLNEFRFSYMRDANDAGQPLGGVGPSLASQGFVSGTGGAGIVPLDRDIEGIENVAFNDFTFGVDITGLKQVNNTYQWIDNFSKVAGKHTLKFGGESHFDQINTKPDVTFNGSFVFQGTETGVDVADFLLGIASSYTQGDSQPFYNRNKYVGAFAEDSWRIRPNLVVNYGTRWDVISPWYEKYNQLQTLVLGEQSRVFPGAPTGLVFPGDPGVPRTLSPTKYDSLAPRMGISYSPDFANGVLAKIFGETGKTALRAGYGLFYTAFEGLSAGIMSANPPYGYSYSSVAPPLFATPFVTASSGQSVGQRFPISFPAYGASPQRPDANVDWSQYLPITGVPSFFHQDVPPYSDNYTLSLQRQIGAGSFLSAAYVGTQAHHLLVLTSANPGNPTLCLSLSQPGEVMAGTPTCGPFGESGTYTTPLGKVVDGTREPFSPQFAAVTYQKTIANSDYNALQLSLRHSSGPLEFMAGYTYSKSLDESSSLAEAVNPLNPELSRALSAFDMRHSFVASYKYRLPFAGLWRRANRWTNDWTISGLTRFAAGFPVTLYNNNDTSLLGTIPNGINNNGVDTPNFAPGNLELNTNPRHGNLAFNTSLFSLPSLGQIGNAPRRFFGGPGINNFDLAIEKDWKFSESKSLQLRLESFNTFNHAQFYGPATVDGNISSADFGQITGAASPRLAQLAAKFVF